MTQKRRYELAIGAACTLTGASVGGLVAQADGVAVGAAIGLGVGAVVARAMTRMLDGS